MCQYVLRYLCLFLQAQAPLIDSRQVYFGAFENLKQKNEILWATPRKSHFFYLFWNHIWF